MSWKDILMLCCIRKENVIYVDFKLIYKLKKEWSL